MLGMNFGLGIGLTLAMPPVVADYLLYDDFAAYADTASISGDIPALGSAWQTYGSVQLASGVIESSSIGYAYQLLDTAPGSIGCEVAFSGSGDANSPYSAAFGFAASSDPFSLDDLLQLNFGPSGFQLAVRQAGGAFVELGSGGWSALVDGTSYAISLSISGDTATVYGPDPGVSFSFTDARIAAAHGSTVYWQPNVTPPPTVWAASAGLNPAAGLSAQAAGRTTWQASAHLAPALTAGAYLGDSSDTVTAVNLSNASLSNLGAQNQGAVIGAITVTGTQTTPVVIGGPDAAKFAVTNGGMVPCNLIAAVDLPAGSYSITLTAT
ncbi:MAG TPA: hypothetical protein VHA37_01870 [Candidatus Saccharimonadales bacterium]|nr:hypothetical protein [Candidatus Saccharimonadales bacterium]